MAGDSEDEIMDEVAPIKLDPPIDPELHSTVTDFVDYTEYFPSDLIRSLTLIRNLDKRYRNATLKVHDLTTQLGNLPNIPNTASRPSAADLRAQMSKALQQAIIFREAARAEAYRLDQSTEKSVARLALIRRKLQELPLPPSRDPTPPPVSPKTVRLQKHEEKTPRITLHMSGQKSMKHRRLLVPGEVLPPPALDDEVYTQTEDSDAGDYDEISVGIVEMSRGRKSGFDRGARSLKATRTVKTPKPIRIRTPGQGTNVHSSVAGISTSNALALLTPPPPGAKPGSRYRPWFKLTEYEMATLRKSMKKNAIWTPSDTMIRRVLQQDGRGPENYAAALAHADETGETFIDEDPVEPGKAVLSPGEVDPTIPAKEVQSLENRGLRLNVAKKEKKLKELAEKEAAEVTVAPPVFSSTPIAIPETVRRSKKDKSSRRATRGQESGDLETATERISQIDDDFKSLFSSNSLAEKTADTSPATAKKSSRSSKKRKRDADRESTTIITEEATPDPNVMPTQGGPKRIKILPPTLAPKPMRKHSDSSSPTKTAFTTTTTTVPLAPAGASPNTISTKRQSTPVPKLPLIETKASVVVQPTAAQSRPRRTSGNIRSTIEEPDSVPITITEPKSEGLQERDLRPRSRGSITGKAASAEPTAKPARSLREQRRASVVEVTHPASDPPTLSINPPRNSRAKRKPAPGFVTDEADGKGKVSVGKRKSAPKKGGAVANKDGKGGMEDEDEEIIDPDEARYCICNGVSFGTMVACENNDCELEWFHLDCVGLKDPPTRRQTWYCPDCRFKLKVSERGDPTETSRRR